MRSLSDREHYDRLVSQSDEQYGLAGVAMRRGDYAQYKQHVDRSWELADQAQGYLDLLNDDEKREIRAHALTSMATAFVKGLGRCTG